MSSRITGKVADSVLKNSCLQNGDYILGVKCEAECTACAAKAGTTGKGATSNWGGQSCHCAPKKDPKKATKPVKKKATKAAAKAKADAAKKAASKAKADAE